MAKNANNNDWKIVVWERIKKEFVSWGLWAIFSFASATIFYIFSNVGLGDFVLLVICVFLVVWSGTGIVKKTIRESKADDPETQRQLAIRKMFEDFIDEANQKGSGWDDTQLNGWISKVQHAMYPLFPESDVKSFVELFSPKGREAGFRTSDQRRQESCAWLRSQCFKYWLN